MMGPWKIVRKITFIFQNSFPLFHIGVGQALYPVNLELVSGNITSTKLLINPLLVFSKQKILK